MIHLPPRLSGSDRASAWLNALRDAVQQLVPRSSVGVKINHGPRGFTIEAAKQRGGGKGGGVRGIVYRGDWSEEGEYGVNDMVTIRDGAAAGTYLAVGTPEDEEDPSAGENWVQIAPGDTVGKWA